MLQKSPPVDVTKDPIFMEMEMEISSLKEELAKKPMPLDVTDDPRYKELEIEISSLKQELASQHPLTRVQVLPKAKS